MNLKDKISVNIMYYCKDNNISDKDLAKKLHCNVMKIKQTLNTGNKSRRFSIPDLEKIANALEIDVAKLINYDEERKKK